MTYDRPPLEQILKNYGITGIHPALQLRAFWRTYNTKGSKRPSARTARANFMRAMTTRLSVRLMVMKKAQGRSSANNCREIVLAKERIVKAAYDATKLKTRIERDRGLSRSNLNASLAGHAAGGRVSIASGALGKVNERT